MKALQRCSGYIVSLAHTLLRALAATRKHLLFMPNFTDVFLFSFFQPFFRSILPDQGICAAPPASRTCFLVDVGFSQLHRGNLLSITVPDSLGPKLSSYHSHRTLFPTECLQAGYSVSMFKEGGWLTEAAQLCLRSCTPNSCVLQSKSMNKCTKSLLANITYMHKRCRMLHRNASSAVRDQ